MAALRSRPNTVGDGNTNKGIIHPPTSMTETKFLLFTISFGTGDRKKGIVALLSVGRLLFGDGDGGAATGPIAAFACAASTTDGYFDGRRTHQRSSFLVRSFGETRAASTQWNLLRNRPFAEGFIDGIGNARTNKQAAEGVDCILSSAAVCGSGSGDGTRLSRQQVLLD